MLPNIDIKINLIWKTIKTVVDPPPPPIMITADTGATPHYSTLSNLHALVNLQPANMIPRVTLPDNSTTYPQQIGHLTLELPPDATETHIFTAFARRLSNIIWSAM